MKKPELFALYCKFLCTELLQISPLKKSLLTTLKAENKFWSWFKTLKLYYRNKADDEMLPVFVQFPWSLKCIFSSTRGKLILLVVIYIRCKLFYILKIFLRKSFCPLKTEIAGFPVKFSFNVPINQLTVSTLVVNCIRGVISLALDKSVIFVTTWARLNKK